MKIIWLFLSSYVLCNALAAAPLVIAHRGASGYLPEHTLEGTAMAHGFGVDFIEPDLVLTKDDQLVILHDIHLDSTTNVKEVFPKRARKDGMFYAIDFDLAEIKRLTVHERINTKTGQPAFPKRFPSTQLNFQVPTFDEFVTLVQGLNQSTGRQVGIYPEIKSAEFHRKEDKDITKIVYVALKKHGYLSRPQEIFIQSFEATPLKRLKNEFQVKVPLIQLMADNSWEMTSEDYNKMQTQKGLQEVRQYADGVGLWIGHLLEKGKSNALSRPTALIPRVKKAKLKIHAYTLRRERLPNVFHSLPQFADFLAKSGVEGFFTDFSDVLAKHYK